MLVGRLYILAGLHMLVGRLHILAGLHMLVDRLHTRRANRIRLRLRRSHRVHPGY